MALGKKSSLQVRNNNVHQLLGFLKDNMHNVIFNLYIGKIQINNK